MVQRLRVRYAKRGRLRFTSHRDIQRAFERALRRAEVPMAYSAGFTPHPRVSYAGAAPTGVASEAEYLELGLAERRDPGALRAALDEALPPGLDVVEVVESGGQALAELLEASVWRISLPGADTDAVAAAVTAFLAADEVVVERLTKSGRRSFDVRAAVISLALTDGEPVLTDNVTPRVGVGGDDLGGGPCAILRLVVRHGTTAVRPDDVLSGLRIAAGFEPPTSPTVTRMAQGPFDPGDGTVADPLAKDRGASSTADEVARASRPAEPGEGAAAVTPMPL